MRLFVAVEVDETVVRTVLDLVARLRARVARHAPRARVAWVTDGRVHMTLAFVGEVDEPTAADVVHALGPPIAMPPFDVECSGLGAFPPRGLPRVLWAGITRGRDELRHLERDVRTRLGLAGVRAETRPYHPHLTLGRVREAGGLRPAALFDSLGDTSLGIFRVEAITLFQSRLSPRGPTYVPLERTALQ